MAGKMGEMASKAGSAASGMVLGAGVGLGALAMRGTLGNVGERLDKAAWVNKMAGGKNLIGKFVGNKLKDTGQKVASKSFDVRNSTLGGMAFKEMGLDSKGKTGGYTKDREDSVRKKQKRAKEIEVNEDEELTQNLNREEMNLQRVLNNVVDDFDRIDKDLAAQRQIKSDNANSPAGSAGEAAHNAAIVEIQRLVDVKKTIKTTDGSAASVAAANAAAAAAPLDKDLAAIARVANACAAVGGQTIKERETVIIPNAKNAKEKESRRRTTNYANNLVWLGGRKNREAQHKIIMGSKIDSGTKV